MNAEYICRRAASRPTLNGRLDHPSWHTAEKSPRFSDMVSGEAGFYDTRAAALWDDEFFYVAFWAEEPFVRATLTERDSLIFLDNDLELFIDGGDCYYEFEVNALGTVYEVFFIWKDAFGKFDAKEWDLARGNVLSFAGNNDRDAETFWRGTHPARCQVGVPRLGPSRPAMRRTRRWTHQRRLGRGPGLDSRVGHSLDRDRRLWRTIDHCRRAKATFGECSLVDSRS